MKKIGRNDPCLCGSGKKFKKCCESKMIGKRFMATKIEPNFFQKTTNISSFFQRNIAPVTISSEIKDLSNEIKIEEKNDLENISLNQEGQVSSNNINS